MSDHKVRLEVKKSEVGKLSLGEKVKVTLTGEVVVLRAQEEFPRMVAEKSNVVHPPEVVVEIKTTKIVPAGNAFAKLAEDDGE